MVAAAGRSPLRADPRRPAHLAPHNYHHVLGEPALVQIGDEGMDGLVELGQHCSQATENVIVVVPLAVAHGAGVVVLRRQRHHGHPRLHQAPGLKVLGPLAIPRADVLRLLRDVEGVAGLVGRDHLQRLGGEGVHAGHAAAAVVQVAAHRVERLQQFAAVADPIQGHVARHPQVGGLGAGDVRLVGLAEKAGVADVVGVAEVDVRRQGGADAGVVAELADHRAERRAVAAEEAAVQFRGGVALLLELHVAKDGQLVGDLRLQGHQLADVHARHLGPDWLELAAVLHRDVGLQVVEVDMAGTAVQVHHDDGLARRAGAGRALRFQPEQVRQGQAAHGEGADLEEVAPGQAVAETPLRSPERQHEQGPPSMGEDSNPDTLVRIGILTHA